MDNIIVGKNITRSFKVGNQEINVLKGFDLEIPTGKLTLLRGRSGSGKTTLMNILGALDYPTGGEVYFDNTDITKLSNKKRDLLRKKDIGFIFQSVALVSMMSAYENVELGLRIARYPIKERKKRVEECLSLVGLHARMNHMPSQMSGGEQQRVAIARAIAHRPKVIFADEPTAELDSTTALHVMKIFKQLVSEQNVTIVMTTHDVSIMEIADKVYVIEDGDITNER